MTIKTVILDIDGTLVDTNFHHTLAWFRAFRHHSLTLPLWRIHRHIGMGGDHFVEALAGAAAEKELGDDIRSTEESCYMDLIDEVQPMDGRVSSFSSSRPAATRSFWLVPPRPTSSITISTSSMCERSSTLGRARRMSRRPSPSPTS